MGIFFRKLVSYETLKIETFSKFLHHWKNSLTLSSRHFDAYGPRIFSYFAWEEMTKKLDKKTKPTCKQCRKHYHDMMKAIKNYKMYLKKKKSKKYGEVWKYNFFKIVWIIYPQKLTLLHVISNHCIFVSGSISKVTLNVFIICC